MYNSICTYEKTELYKSYEIYLGRNNWDMMNNSCKDKSEFYYTEFIHQAKRGMLACQKRKKTALR